MSVAQHFLLHTELGLTCVTYGMLVPKGTDTLKLCSLLRLDGHLCAPSRQIVKNSQIPVKMKGFISDAFNFAFNLRQVSSVRDPGQPIRAPDLA